MSDPLDLAPVKALLDTYPGPYTVITGQLKDGLPFMGGLGQQGRYITDMKVLHAVVEAYKAVPLLAAEVERLRREVAQLSRQLRYTDNPASATPLAGPRPMATIARSMRRPGGRNSDEVVGR